MRSVNLSDMNIPPDHYRNGAGVGRAENALIPIAEENGMLQIAMRDPYDHETALKIQFILARDIQPALRPRSRLSPLLIGITDNRKAESVTS